jgi:hypothetical protein
MSEGARLSGATALTLNGRAAYAKAFRETAAAVQGDGLGTPSAREAGITYQWAIADKRPLNLPQTIGNGCAVGDATTADID